VSASSRPARRVGRLVLRAGAALIICLGILLLSLRLAMPLISGQGAALERWLGSRLGDQVRIGSVRGYWRGWTPELVLEAIRLRPKAPGSKAASSVRLSRVRLTLDPLASLRALAPRIAAITLTGVAIAVERDASGALRLRGLGSDGRAGTHAALPAALTGSTRLRLEHTALIWIDHRTRRPPLVLTDGTLDLITDGPRHRLSATLKLPRQYGGKVTLRARIEGNPTDSDWSGDVYLDAPEVRLVAGQVAGYPESARFGDSTIGFKIWSHWRAGRLVRATGEYVVPKLEWTAAPGNTVAITSPAGAFAWSRNDAGWQLVAGLDKRVSGAVLALSGGTDGSRMRLRGRLRGVALGDLVTAAQGFQEVPEIWSSMLARLGPQGILSDLDFGLSPGPRWRDDLRAVAHVHAVSARSEQPDVRLSGVDARIESDGSRMVARIDSGEIESTLGGLLSRAHTFKNLSGRIVGSWRSGDRHIGFHDVKLTLDGNALRARAALRWAPNGVGPAVTALLAMNGGAIDSLAPYVPTRGLHAGLARWLRTAAKGIRIADAALLLRTDDLRLPSFVKGDTTIDLHARLAVKRLNYTRGWPPLRGLASSIDLRDLRIRAQVDRGTVAGARIVGAKVAINDMTRKPAIVSLRGSVEGDSRQGVRFLTESPLASNFSYVIDELKPRGPTAVKLELSVPLKKGARARAEGSIRVTGNEVAIPGFLRGLSAVTAKIDFDGNSFRTRGASARYLGRTIVLDAEKAAGGSGATRLELAGSADRDYLVRHLRNAGLLAGLDAGISPLLARLRGEGTWRALITLPARGRPGGSEAPRLRFTSELNGVDLDLPQPFTKRSAERRRLVVENRFLADGVRILKLRFGDAAAILRLVPGTDGHRVERGRIRFGAGRVSLPDKPGVVLEGRLEHLVLSEWRRFLSGGDNKASEAARSVRAADLQVADLDLLGHRFAATRVRATQTTGAWKVRVDARDIAGRITIPTDLERSPLRIDLDQLTLAKPEETEKSDRRTRAPVGIDPRKVPAIDFTTRKLVYAGRDLGAARLLAARDPNGLRLERIYLAAPGLEVEGRGLWTIKDRRRQSRVKLSVHTEDLGRLMAKLGYDDTGARGGTADFRIDGRWPGAPADLSLERGSGSVTIHATKGRLVGVRRGTSGRLFGLLSLAALPRRLLLDFNDLFEDGLRYDRLEGKFGIDGGNAYTSGLTIDGPIARIDISGRTGLIDHDYDEIVTVTPKLSKSLPFAPVWLAEKLLRKKVFDRSFAYQYTVTGAWDDPIVAPVADEPREPVAEQER